MSELRFNGDDYDHERDAERLTKQHERIASLMLPGPRGRDGRRRTVAMISAATGIPENSVQAQLRHLRKPRFGGYIVTKEREDGGLYWYQVRERREDDPPYVGGSRTERAAKLEELLSRVSAAMARAEATGVALQAKTCGLWARRIDERVKTIKGGRG